MALQIFLSRGTFGKTSFQKVVDKVVCASAVMILIEGSTVSEVRTQGKDHNAQRTLIL